MNLMGLLIVKFILGIIGIFSLTLYISALVSNKSLWNADDIKENAKFRIINGIIIAVCFSFLIVF